MGLCARDDPGLSSLGAGSVCAPDSCLLAPADDRYALATTAGGIVLAVCRCTLKPILAAMPARSISLASPETVNGAPGNEDEGRLGLALQCPQSQFHPRAVGKLHRVTICREFSSSDQIIKSEQVGTDRPCRSSARKRWSAEPPNGPPAGPSWGEGRIASAPVGPSRGQCFACEPTADVASSWRNSAS